MRTKLTQEEFIKRSRFIHQNKYDYSSALYINNRTKVTIRCPEHGSFKQIPNSHLNGNGCRLCKNEKISNLFKVTLEEFIQKAKETHGDLYDYSNVVYLGANIKVSITCKNHGPFNQTPGCHVYGQGCPQCRNDKTSQALKLGKDEFVKKAIKKHNGKYDYTYVDYENNRTYVTIICPDHGEFFQRPTSHLNGSGCSSCKSSKGELTIRDILLKHNVKFIQQYKIPNTEYKFRYDFFLPDHNVIIEFHGIQHYEPVDYFGGVEAFKLNRKRDAFKLALAKLAKIPILYFNHKQLRSLGKQEFSDMILKTLNTRRNKSSELYLTS